MESILSAQEVTKRFGGLVAVNRLDVEIRQQSISSIIGPNGAGKTTFFNCITGFYNPEEGRIIFDGEEIQGLSTDMVTRRGIARTYQNIRLFANMTAVENILVGHHPHLHANWFDAVLHTPRFHQEEKDALQEALRLLKFVGLGGMGDQFARNLPYGAQRRLEIARALASRPKLLLLDEPTAGMNPHETDEMTSSSATCAMNWASPFCSSSTICVVMGISEQISVMDFGLKIAEGTRKIFRATARHRSLLGSGRPPG
jgi:branched-chain amino acid transport system ATP-binding protein